MHGTPVDYLLMKRTFITDDMPFILKFSKMERVA